LCKEIVAAEKIYGRSAVMWVEADCKCDSCGTVTTCLVADTSDGEYNVVSACRKCVDALFEETTNA
jgi:hypothetical protein